jgi:hypothetical protein
MVQQTFDYQKFITKDIYDWVCRVGSKARSFNVKIDKTTVNNILEMFKGDPIDACQLLEIYIVRQAGRKEIDRDLAQDLIKDINTIYNSFNGDKKTLGEVLMKYLILFKWVYESKCVYGENFREFINNFIGERR